MAAAEDTPNDPLLAALSALWFAYTDSLETMQTFVEDPAIKRFVDKYGHQCSYFVLLSEEDPTMALGVEVIPNSTLAGDDQFGLIDTTQQTPMTGIISDRFPRVIWAGEQPEGAPTPLATEISTEGVSGPQPIERIHDPDAVAYVAYNVLCDALEEIQFSVWACLEVALSADSAGAPTAERLTPDTPAAIKLKETANHSALPTSLAVLRWAGLDDALTHTQRMIDAVQECIRNLNPA